MFEKNLTRRNVMEFNRQDIKMNAKNAFKASYWPMVGITILGELILAAASAATMIPMVGLLSSIMLVPLLSVAFTYFYYTVYMGGTPNSGQLFDGFRDGRMGHVMGGFWYRSLFLMLWGLIQVVPMLVYYFCTIFGWILIQNMANEAAIVIHTIKNVSYVLMTIGGIIVYIKGLQYSMIPYILMDQPEVSATAALKLSKDMTKGYKMKMFVYGLSFLGWDILSVITCGIVWIFYVGPYRLTADAGIYDCLKRIYTGDDQMTYESQAEETVVEEVTE